MVDYINLPTMMGTQEAQKYVNIILTISFCIIFFISFKIIRKISPKMNALIIYFGPFVSTRFRRKFWRDDPEKSKESQKAKEISMDQKEKDFLENRENREKPEQTTFDESDSCLTFLDNSEKVQNLQKSSLPHDIIPTKDYDSFNNIIEWNQEDYVCHRQNLYNKFKSEIENPNFDFEKIRQIYRNLSLKNQVNEEAFELYINALQRHCQEKNNALVADDSLFLELADYCDQKSLSISLQTLNTILRLFTYKKLKLYNRSWIIYEKFNNMINIRISIPGLEQDNEILQVEKFSILIQNFILEEFNKAEQIKKEISKRMESSPDNSKYIELLHQIDQKLILLYNQKIDKNDFNLSLNSNSNVNVISNSNSKNYNSGIKINDDLTKESYNNLIIYNAKKQNFEKACKAFKEMYDLGIKPEEFSISLLIECAIKTENYLSIKSIHQKISSLGIEISSLIGTNLIQAYSLTKDFRNARSVFEKLLNAGLIYLNIIPMNAMLDCCIVCNNYEYFFFLYKNLFPLESSKFAPDLVTYSTIIKGLCKNDLLEEALIIFEIVKKQNIKLDEQIFTCLLQGFAKSQIPHKAFRIVEEMEKLNIQKSKYTNSILIKIYGLVNRADLALKCFESIKATEEDIGNISYTCIIKALCKNKEAFKAISIFQEMVAKNLPIDKVLYNTIIKGCIISRKINYACAILKRSIDKQIVLAVDIYNSVLRALLISNEVVREAKFEYLSQFFNFIKIKVIPVESQIMASITNILFGNFQTYGSQGVYYAVQYY